MPCGRPWSKHGHAVSDYDPDTGSIRTNEGQAEVTSEMEARTEALVEAIRATTAAPFFSLQPEELLDP